MKPTSQSLFESLEPRVLLSAALFGQNLHIRGTNDADSIIVEPGPAAGDVVLHGVDGVEDGTVYHDVKRISIATRDGDDSIQILDNVVDADGAPIGVIIFAGDGNDTVVSGSGNDLVFGGKGDDNLGGGDGNDRLLGQLGDDILNGDAGEDILIGGFGDDQLDGGSDNDRLRGGRGDDMITANDGDDVFDGGLGLDTFDASKALAAVTVNLKDAIATGEMIGHNAVRRVENIIGSNFVDHLIGNRLINKILAGEDDVVDGGGGEDSIVMFTPPPIDPNVIPPDLSTLIEEATGIALGQAESLFADSAIVEQIQTDLAALRAKYPILNDTAFLGKYAPNTLRISIATVEQAGLQVSQIETAIDFVLTGLGINTSPITNDGTYLTLELDKLTNVDLLIDLLNAAGITGVEPEYFDSQGTTVEVDGSTYTLVIGEGSNPLRLPFTIEGGEVTPNFNPLSLIFDPRATPLLGLLTQLLI